MKRRLSTMRDVYGSPLTPTLYFPIELGLKSRVQRLFPCSCLSYASSPPQKKQCSHLSQENGKKHTCSLFHPLIIIIIIISHAAFNSSGLRLIRMWDNSTGTRSTVTTRYVHKDGHKETSQVCRLSLKMGI
jgi:hypothetical protein